MALNDLELSLMAFPQRWSGAAETLALNVLLLPVGDPTVRFAGGAIPLKLNFAAGLDTLPKTSTVPTRSVAFAAQPAPVAPAIFTRLRDELVAKGIVVTSAKLATAPHPERPRPEIPARQATATPSHLRSPAPATFASATASVALSAPRRPA